uniref:COX assembly mitochondrial protein n=3 Tax=Aegilops tauschii subsp. strangulata TaxID=200361 RepID=A0A453C261_AEGTS
PSPSSVYCRCALQISLTPAPLWQLSIRLEVCLCKVRVPTSLEMHPHLTLHRHPMCAEIIEEFQKCHVDHPIKKFFGECTDLKIKLDRCFRQEKAVKRKANFEESMKFKERLQAYKKEMAEKENES